VGLKVHDQPKRVIYHLGGGFVGNRLMTVLLTLDNELPSDLDRLVALRSECFAGRGFDRRSAYASWNVGSRKPITGITAGCAPTATGHAAAAALSAQSHAPRHPSRRD
jgi:hypothetical protein